MADEAYAGIHAAITALSVDVGRLSERLIALDSKLVHHTTSEHREFKEALEIVQGIKEDVNGIQSILDNQKGAWMALAKIAAVIAGVVTVAAAIVEFIAHR